MLGSALGVTCCSLAGSSSGLVSLSSGNSLSGFARSTALESSVLAAAVVEAEPSDAMLTRVVVASAGRDLDEAPAFRVS